MFQRTWLWDPFPIPCRLPVSGSVTWCCPPPIATVRAARRNTTHKLLLEIFSRLSMTSLSRQLCLGFLRSGGCGHHSLLVSIGIVLGTEGGVRRSCRLGVWESAGKWVKGTYQGVGWQAFQGTWRVVSPNERLWNSQYISTRRAYLSAS
jgi:hypothetical protein